MKFQITLKESIEEAAKEQVAQKAYGQPLDSDDREDLLENAREKLTGAILSSPCHVIATMRSKMEYILEESTNKQGRTAKP